MKSRKYKKRRDKKKYSRKNKRKNLKIKRKMKRKKTKKNRRDKKINFRRKQINRTLKMFKKINMEMKKNKFFNMNGGNCVERPGASNMGKVFTGVDLNNNPSLSHPINTSIPYSRPSNSGQSGGFLMQDIGLGDVLLNWYNGQNAILNTYKTWIGGKHIPNAHPTVQNVNKHTYEYKLPNIN